MTFYLFESSFFFISFAFLPFSPRLVLKQNWPVWKKYVTDKLKKKSCMYPDVQDSDVDVFVRYQLV